MTTLKVRFRPSPTDDGDAARHTSRTVQTACPPPPLPCRDGEGTDSFLAFARATISHLRGIGRERLAETYTSSVNSFMRFRGGRRRQYLNAIHLINSRLKVIGHRVKSPVTLSTYVARHGWASIAKSRNVPLAVISEAMGHDSESTTRIYLATLDSTPVDEANRQVIFSV